MSQEKYAGFYFATKQALAPQSIASTTATGTGFDRLGYNHMIAVANTGSFAGTTLDIKIQDSASLSTGYADFTANVTFDSNNTYTTTAAFPTITTTGVSKLDVDLMAAKRYIRFVALSAGTNLVGVTALLGQRDGTVPGVSA
jgi:hypothetical protein